MLERMTAAPISLSGVATGFGALSGKMGVSGVSLREALFGSAFSVSLSGQGVVAMSSKLAGALSSDETDAVLAHELSHIKNGDSAAKGLAKLARVAFPFDPVLRLVEAAVHRERELWADKVSVEFTGKPRALASAIVKAHSESNGGTTSNLAGLFVGGGGPREASGHSTGAGSSDGSRQQPIRRFLSQPYRKNSNCVPVAW